MQQRVILTTVLILSMVGCSSTVPLTAESEQVSGASKQFLLTYPNLQDPDGEVVFENEHVILQRLVVPAGEWEGVHSHPGSQLSVTDQERETGHFYFGETGHFYLGTTGKVR